MTMATDSDGRPETCAHIAAGSLFSRFVVFFFFVSPQSTKFRWPLAGWCKGRRGLRPRIQQLPQPAHALSLLLAHGASTTLHFFNRFYFFFFLK